MKVKAAIAALCKLLAGFGVRPVPGAGEAAAIYPEIFRQAKFDRKEATAEFWKLLHWLLKLVNEDGPCEVIDLADQIEYVKAAVCYYGYGFMDFYQLPADGTWGSRDLLLAFSWLLQKIHLLEQLLNLQRLHVEDQVSLCTCRQAIPISPVERSDLRDGRHPAGMDVRYLQCLQGKLRFRWRSLYSAQQERCSALYKIHLYTRGCSSSQSIDHLSATETRLIQDPKQCGEFVQLLERENMRLEAYLEWKQLEPLYWQWMIKDQERGMGTHARQREAVFLTQCDVERKLGAVQARASHKSRGHSHVGLALRANSTPVRTKPPSAQQHNVSGSLTASEVITQLRAEATELKKELQELQQLSREALGEIVERLDRVICIPPMQR
ncbi:tubulin epsilon and delta complex protein 1 isoform X2 [Heterodontus francisci]|uniref:tubulin epsilon and delta complex protein 1 isoform X2 n=1 Tax=Heterodontus francisci TaxID=7792 RepID=UPI00355B2711